MVKEKTINWIKLHPEVDAKIPSLKLIEQWVADNADLQILKRYTITKVAIPKAHQKKAQAAYLVQWRKALQQFKGRWQWREVESYLLIEDDVKIATTVTKSAAQPTEAKVQKPAIANSTAKVETKKPQQLVESQQTASDASVKAEPKAMSAQKARPAKNKTPKPDTRLEPKKATEHVKVHHSKKIESQNNAVKKRHTSGNNMHHNTDTNANDNGKHKAGANLVKVQPVLLYGLETKQQSLYSRRPLSKN